MAAMASASAAHNVGPPVACTARRALRCAPRCRAAPPVSRLHPGRGARRRGGAATCAVVVAAAAASESSTDPSPGGGGETAAARAVAAGLLAYEAGKHSDAVQHFTAALDAAPSDDEARAALYNRACALSALARFDDAAEDLRKAVNDYRLKYSVAATDGDLGALRAWRGWPELAPSLSGFSASTGTPASVPGAATAKLRAEAKAPFRLLRLFLFGGLFAGAVVASLVTLPALVKALTLLSDPAADSGEALRSNGLNSLVNSAVLLATGWAARQELGAKAAAEEEATREEQLGTLRVLTGTQQSAALVELRGRYRPVLVVGSVPHLRGCARAAEPHKRELLARNVIITALQEEDGAAAGAPKPKGFAAPSAQASTSAAAPAGSGITDAFGPPVGEAGRWRADVYDVPTWRTWASTQRQRLGLSPGQPFWVSLALDGSVRSAAAGAPNWEELVKAFAPVTADSTT